MHLILHIGLPKTGTTTFQHWATANRQNLQDQGFWYAARPGSSVYRGLLTLFSDHQIDLQDPSLAAIREKNRKTEAFEELESWVQEARGAGSGYFVISDEGLCGGLGRDAINNAAEHLARLFSSWTVCAHLRPQADIAVSLSSTAAVRGEFINKAWLTKQAEDRATFDYHQLYLRWADLFGRENVEMPVFRRDPCFTTWFIKRFNVDTAGFSAIERRNEALDIRALALSNVITLESRTHVGPGHKKGPLYLEEIPVAEKISFGIENLRAFQSEFAESNIQLAAANSKIETDDLEPDWDAHDRPSNLHWLEADCPYADHLSLIISRYRTEIFLERSQSSFDRARLARLSDNPSGVEKHLARAEQHLKKAKLGASRTPKMDAMIKRLDQRLRSFKSQPPPRRRWWPFVGRSDDGLD